MMEHMPEHQLGCIWIRVAGRSAMASGRAPLQTMELSDSRVSGVPLCRTIETRLSR